MFTLGGGGDLRLRFRCPRCGNVTLERHPASSWITCLPCREQTMTEKEDYMYYAGIDLGNDGAIVVLKGDRDQPATWYTWESATFGANGSHEPYEEAIRSFHADFQGVEVRIAIEKPLKMRSHLATAALWWAYGYAACLLKEESWVGIYPRTWQSAMMGDLAGKSKDKSYEASAFFVDPFDGLADAHNIAKYGRMHITWENVSSPTAP